MTSTVRADLEPLVPFLIGGGMAVGSFFGFVSSVPMLLNEGPSGDMAGAAGALTMILSGGAGAFASTVSLAVARALGRGTPQQMLLRGVLSLVAGAGFGVIGSAEGELASAMMWFLLLGAPALIAWFWRSGRPVTQPPAARETPNP